MTDLFISLFNMSITAGWLVLAVILLRFLLKKAPKWVNAVLWAFVGFRLICPFSFESIFSLVPSTDTVPHDIIYSPTPSIHSGIPALNSTFNPIISETFSPDVTASVNPIQIVLFVAVIIWIIGIITMLIYSGVSFFRLNNKVREGVVLKDNIWLCDRIDTPFILGLIKPRIFLPSGMTESDTEYVIAHENAHLKRRDHWWKPLGFILLTVYWFNPMMWLAYILLCHDIELACDEKVIKEMGADMKKSYSEALINCSVSRRTISACPLAFGETGVKGRIKSVLSYKKPTLWIIIIAVISCIVVGVCFLTNPKTDLKKTNPELDKAVSQAIFEINEVTLDILEFNSAEYPEFECTAEGHIIYGYEEEGDNVTVYLREQFAGFIFQNGYFVAETVHRLPAVFVFVKTDNGYTLSDYNFAEIGLYYDNSIKSLFPSEYYSRVMNVRDKDYADLWAQCVAYAEDYLKKIGREAEIRDYSEVPHTMLTDVGVSVEVSHNLTENSSFNKYNSDIGYYETLEDGIRYVYRTDYDDKRNVIIYTTEVYTTGDIIEKIEVNGETGKIILRENYVVQLPKPEIYPENKNDYAEKLDYTVAAQTVKEMSDKYSITAIHCPASGAVESGILMGEAYCNEVAAFLNSVNWKKSLPPIESLSSPGSVEFVIEEDYRVTVYERKKGSVFAYAVVKCGEEERYYYASYDDYKDAVAILHPPAEISGSSIAYPVNSYSYLTEYDSAYISLTPVTKQAHFSLSRLSSYFCIGRYTENEDEVIITAQDMKHQYTFRKDGDNLVFVADKSSPVPEYKYETDMNPVPCIPDGAVFDCHGIESGYIDKAYTDIDGDGIKEDCILGYGPTSGLFTVTFSVYENGYIEYFNIFNSNAQDISFGWSKAGKAVIREQIIADYDNIVYAEYEINIKDGNIVLGSGDGMMAYWGEQGLDSPYAPK